MDPSENPCRIVICNGMGTYILFSIIKNQRCSLLTMLAQVNVLNRVFQWLNEFVLFSFFLLHITYCNLKTSVNSGSFEQSQNQCSGSAS